MTGQYRPFRTLLLERDPEKVEADMPPIQSIKDADWRHQKAAMMRGYNSMTEMAVDEMIVVIRDLQKRVDALEHDVRPSDGFGEVVEFE